MITMNNAFEEFASGSQSPYNLGRSAHPGAVLLSPQSSAMNLSNSAASTGILSPQLTSQSHGLSFDEILDQQSALLDPSAQHSQQQPSMQQPGPLPTSSSAAGSAVMSPMIQSPSRTPANIPTSSMFLESFTRPSSSSLLGMHNRSKSCNKEQAQGKQQPQSASSKQLQPRPAEANPVVNFTQDINQLCSWMSMLSSSQQNVVMDNLLSTLNEDVLHYTKLKLDSLINSGYLSPQIPAIASPVPNREAYSIANLDSVFSDGKLADNDTKPGERIDPMIENSAIYQKWSPQPASVTQPIYDYIKDMNQRPKSADPHVSRMNVNLIGKKGTNGIHGYTANNGYYFMPGKSRAATSDFENNNSQNFYGGNRSQNGASSHATTSSHNSHSQSPDRSAGGTASITPTASAATNPSTNSVPGVSSGTGHGSSMNPRTLTDPRLLTNIPMWLKALRLHKYSDALSSKKWDELIYLDDETLEKMGISALGARRKLLKAFAIVKDHKEQGLIDQTAYV
ncbi:hypothetical protein HG536_0F04430 [Torulaspora globosa]|uniref:RNA-binding protein VTS1 n=1 Tax=Torulaspora globosa TaxID=48254 RepID=A0A7G3ZKT1_9SACH|nr:uncharacterized protein HG536_0F04430 [Torulaspora globosa]QLL34117.1 hypothetical protein HG536_0F04430 [Torulaspora globosa]